MQRNNEITPYASSDDYASTVGGILLHGIEDTGSHEADSLMPEVISGRDRGYLRTNPEAVHGLLLQSIADGNVLTGEHAAVDQCAMCAGCGSDGCRVWVDSSQLCASARP